MKQRETDQGLTLLGFLSLTLTIMLTQTLIMNSALTLPNPKESPVASLLRATMEDAVRVRRAEADDQVKVQSLIRSLMLMFEP